MADGSTPARQPAHIAGFALGPLVKMGKRADDCWRWLGAFDTAGNPAKRCCGKDFTAQRWMYSVLFGTPPRGLVVTTSCGTRECCNPHHLRLCTMAAAQQDGINAKLTIDDVRELRVLVDNGVPRDVVADRYGISETTVSDVMTRKSWKARSQQRPCRLPKRETAHG